MTGFSLFSTSSSKLSSVTFLVAPTMRTSFHAASCCGLSGLAASGLGVGKPALGVQRRGAAGPRGGHRLAVGVVDHVPGREDAFDGSARRRLVHQQVSLGVRLEHTGEELAARVVADGDEYAADLERALRSGVDVAEPQAGYPVRTDHLGNLAVPGEPDLRVRQRAVLHDLRSPQRVATVDDRDRARESGQERGLLHRRVTAADHGDILVAEEEAVAGGAPGHAMPGKPLLPGDAELAVA